jgi:ABC-type taurine transport system ATPase subunit
VRALFVSFNGFTEDCITALDQRGAGERVILMDGADLRTVLNADIAFDVLLDEKLARAVRNDRAFVSAREIILEKIEGKKK